MLFNCINCIVDMLYIRLISNKLDLNHATTCSFILVSDSRSVLIRPTNDERKKGFIKIVS